MFLVVKVDKNKKTEISTYSTIQQIKDSLWFNRFFREENEKTKECIEILRNARNSNEINLQIEFDGFVFNFHSLSIN